METIRSKDGTSIAYQRSGAGSPLVLVHGTGGSYTRWTPILPALEKHFRVFAIDRRGRGESGDSEPYAHAREFEDIAAVVDSIGESVCLLGHSFGAICSLEAALLTSNLHKLILYEPPIPVGGVQIYPEGIIDQLQALLVAGDGGGVLTTFFQEVVKMPSHEFELFKSSPAWPARVAAAHTLPRELRVAERYQFEAERFTKLPVPALLLLGGDSPAFFKAAIETLAAALPNSQAVVLPGQQHIAIDTAPDLFAHEVLAFLNTPD
ncbi:MAG: alpha/beta hydrolase [Chloroflexi bacterium]|nr:alpha/beta hydrolase [Chloroflexota bacterium]